MDDPVLVEVTRGGRVESAHRGAFAIVDADGGVAASAGDIDRPVFPRSAVKAIQALPLVEDGAAGRLGLGAAEIALACASHSGEPLHVETAKAMLARAGRDASCLECGAHWPGREQAARELFASGGEPGPEHNNCSGKHAGFVCLACDAGVDPAGYVQPEHFVQRRIAGTLGEVTGARIAEDVRGIDGCSIPTWAIPLRALALGFARFGTGRGFGPRRAAAALAIREAVAQEPFMVGGTGKFDTAVMQALGMRAFVKTGAEGVYCAALPELGLGVALKIDDGATRASETAMARLIEMRLPLAGEAADVVAQKARRTLRNWNLIEVGEVRPAGPLA
jgi:L-asparaginase II